MEADAPQLSAEQLDVARLLVSELVTNAVRHGAGDEVVLALRVDGARARFEVHDAGGRQPARHDPRGADGGYGLNLVATLAARWGADPESGVWFELDRAPPADARPAIGDAIAGQLDTILDELAEAVTVWTTRARSSTPTTPRRDLLR